MTKHNSQNTITNIIFNNMHPKKLFHAPWDSLRVVIGIFIAILVGFILKNPDLQALLAVGSFLAGILILIPHHSNRALVGISNSFLLILAFFTGALLHSDTVLLYVIFFVLIFISGLLRKIGIAIGIKALILSIFVLASAQMSPDLKTGMTISFGIGAGVLITLICQILPPYTNKFTYEKQCLSNVFKQLALDAHSLVNKKRNTSAYLGAIHLSRNSLDSLDKNSKYNINFLFELVAKAEIIEDCFNFIYLNGIHNSQEKELKEIENSLIDISNKLNNKNNKNFSFEHELKNIFAHLNKYNFNEEISSKSEFNQLLNSPKASKNIIKLLLDELNFKSPIFIQSIRLSIFVMVATVAGDLLNYFPSISVPGHGFWIPLTTAIVLFPDYVDTFTRSIERTLGTITGAIVGYLISLLPLGLLGHSIITLILLCGYIFFRSSGQAWIMFWIVAWLCNLSVLHHVAVPRAVDTIIGSILALIACVIWPTWNTNKIDKLLANWVKLQGQYIQGIITLNLNSNSFKPSKLNVIRHKSNLTHQQLLGNIKKAKFEPVFSNSKWNNAALDELTSLITDITYKVSSLNVTLEKVDSKNSNINEFAEKLNSSMECLSEFIIGSTTKISQYEYNIENLKADINEEKLSPAFKENLKTLISDIEILDSTIKLIHLPQEKLA